MHDTPRYARQPQSTGRGIGPNEAGSKQKCPRVSRTQGTSARYPVGLRIHETTRSHARSYHSFGLSRFACRRCSPRRRAVRDCPTGAFEVRLQIQWDQRLCRPPRCGPSHPTEQRLPHLTGDPIPGPEGSPPSRSRCRFAHVPLLLHSPGCHAWCLDNPKVSGQVVRPTNTVT
jgi:hypothetical protein